MKVHIELPCPAWIFCDFGEGTENFLPTAISNTYSNTHPSVRTRTHTPQMQIFCIAKYKFGYDGDSCTLCKQRSIRKSAPAITRNKWEIIFSFSSLIL